MPMTSANPEPNAPLWSPTPEQIASSRLREFMDFASARTESSFESYDALHDWSISDMVGFWDTIWDFFDVRGDKGSSTVVQGNGMPGSRFFPDATLNFAENLLAGPDRGPALLFRGEDKVRREMDWQELRALVSRLQQAMRAAGVGRGDRVAAMMPNMPETVALMLAATSLGAIWSSCSPDFGERGVLDRFGQIEPTIFIACDGYWYNGKVQDIAAKLSVIAKDLQPARTIIVPYLGKAADVAEGLPSAVSLDDFIAPFDPEALTFERLPFDHPLYILFSSGTTGVPKCIVHRAGGVLLQHLKEHGLHCGIRPGDRLFYFTTCGWMMGNWLVSGLAVGATL